MGRQREPLLQGMDEGHFLRFLRGIEAGSSIGLLPGRITPEGNLGVAGALGMGAGMAVDPLGKLLGVLKGGTMGVNAIRGARAAHAAPEALEAIHLLAPVVNTAGRAAKYQTPGKVDELFNFLSEIVTAGPNPTSRVGAARESITVGGRVAKEQVDSNVRKDKIRQEAFERRRAFEQERVRNERRSR